MKLKELRKSRNITQNELAQKFNVSNQTILNWENNIFSPSVQQLKDLADFFQVSVDFLIEHETKNLNSKFKYENLSKEELIEIVDSISKIVNK